MSNIYDGILRRLVEYRSKNDLTQADMSAMIGKKQSQLSKIELGKIIISFDDLSGMMKAGMDIDDLIIEKPGIEWKSDVNEVTHFQDKKLLADIKDVLLWSMGQALGEKGIIADKALDCEYKLLKTVIVQNELFSLLLELRKMIGVTQMSMAEKLGVNIKKYRDLERRITNPDAELLALIYEITSCKPSLFFHQDDMKEYLLNDLWNRISDAKKQEIMSFLDYAMKLRGV